MIKVHIPTVCFLSPIGTDNYPNARFVLMKDAGETNLIVIVTTASRKGIEINKTNNVALTIWWIQTERQIIIQG